MAVLKALQAVARDHRIQVVVRQPDLVVGGPVREVVDALQQPVYGLTQVHLSRYSLLDARFRLTLPFWSY